MADPADETLEIDFFGPPTPAWTEDTVTGRVYANVEITKLYQDKLYGRLPGLRLDQGSPVWVRLPMYDQGTGAPLKVTTGQYSTAPTVACRYREASGYDRRVMEPSGDDATPALDETGRYLLLPVPTEVVNNPGVYTMQASVRDGNGLERVRNQLTVLVDRGLFLADGGAPDDRGPPTLAEVRVALRDHPAANRLLGEYEFDAAEVGSAIVHAVQAFANGFPPLPPQWNLPTTRWPAGARRPLTDGILTQLFETAAHYHRRGHLPYSAGGLTVDDLAKEKDYAQAVAFYRERFETWVKMVRSKVNIAAGWGSLASPYSYQWW